MKIVVLERNSVGLDVSVEGIRQLGEVVEYANTTGLTSKRGSGMRKLLWQTRRL